MPTKNPAAVSMGRLGGQKGGVARAKVLTPKQRSEIASKAANARWHRKEPETVDDGFQEIRANRFVRSRNVASQKILSLSKVTECCRSPNVKPHVVFDMQCQVFLALEDGRIFNKVFRLRFDESNINP